MVERVKHERILLERPARIFVERDGALLFETYCKSRDLSISGIFLNTSALLRLGTQVDIDLEVRDGEVLSLNGIVIRRIEFGDREHEPGFAVQFGALSPRSHETLLHRDLYTHLSAALPTFGRHGVRAGPRARRQPLGGPAPQLDRRQPAHGPREPASVFVVCRATATSRTAPCHRASRSESRAVAGPAAFSAIAAARNRAHPSRANARANVNAHASASAAASHAHTDEVRECEEK
jgi:PilZ domain